LWFKASPRQTVWETPSWKNPTQKKGWWNGSRERACLASVIPWVQVPVLCIFKKKNVPQTHRAGQELTS
jgi:hypothetical protein